MHKQKLFCVQLDALTALDLPEAKLPSKRLPKSPGVGLFLDV